MDTAFYASRSRLAGRSFHEQAVQQHLLEEENSRLKVLLADALLENATLRRSPVVENDSDPGDAPVLPSVHWAS